MVLSLPCRLADTSGEIRGRLFHALAPVADAAVGGSRSRRIDCRRAACYHTPVSMI